MPNCSKCWRTFETLKPVQDPKTGDTRNVCKNCEPDFALPKLVQVMYGIRCRLCGRGYSEEVPHHLCYDGTYIAICAQCIDPDRVHISPISVSSQQTTMFVSDLTAA